MQTSNVRTDDQAAGLRQMVGAKPVKVIAVTAGKGGVGKTNISANLAIALGQQQQRVLLLDADLGLANIDILLGLHATKNLNHVIEGDCDLEDIMIDGPANLKIVPASSGVEMMTKLSSHEHAGLISAFSHLSDNLDAMIIDTAAGISDSVISFTRAAQEVIVVVCDEPTSITDAYALIKVMSQQYNINSFRILANMVGNLYEGRHLFAKLCRVTDRFLEVNLDYVGAIPFDEHLKKAVQQQKAVIEAYPSSKSAKEFKKIARKIIDWPTKRDSNGNVTFFIERLIQSNDEAF